MAVVETYADSNLSSGTKQSSSAGGASIYSLTQNVAVAAADDDTSTYVMGLIHGNDKPFNIRVFNDALTSGTDWDLGVYVWNGDSNALGAVVDADLFADGLDLSSAADDTFALTAPDINLLGTSTVKEMLEAASITDNLEETQYALVLTGNTVGSAAGDITVTYQAYKDA